MVRLVGTRDYQPKTFVTPFIHYAPRAGTDVIPAVIRDPGYQENPLCRTGPEYRSGDAAFSNFGWFPPKQ